MLSQPVLLHAWSRSGVTSQEERKPRWDEVRAARYRLPRAHTVCRPPAMRRRRGRREEESRRRPFCCFVKLFINGIHTYIDESTSCHDRPLTHMGRVGVDGGRRRSRVGDRHWRCAARPDRAADKGDAVDCAFVLPQVRVRVREAARVGVPAVQEQVADEHAALGIRYCCGHFPGGKEATLG